MNINIELPDRHLPAILLLLLCVLLMSKVPPFICSWRSS